MTLAHAFHHRPMRWAIAAVLTLATACSGQTSPAAPAPAPTQTAPPQAATQPPTLAPVAQVTPATTPHSNLAGQTVTLWTVKRDNLSTPLNALIPAFEQQTGIQVNFVEVPEQGYQDKLKLAQVAKDSSYDIFEDDPTSMPAYIDRQAVEPLDSYINDPQQTPADWDFQDISQGLVSVDKHNNQIYALPMFATTTFLYYNKAIFAAAGISGPPQSINDLINDAKLTNGSGHAGICMRAQPDVANDYIGTMLSQYFIPYDPNNKGAYLGPDWKPLLTTQGGLDWANAYATLMLNYAPAGIASYGYLECNRDFEQGTVAQYFEADAWNGDFSDPAKSTVAKNVGFAAIPCPPSNPDHCIISAQASWSINANSQHKAAAWQLLQWILSKDTLTKLVTSSRMTDAAIRTSVLSQVVENLNMPNDLQSALSYSLSHINANAFPAITAYPQVAQSLKVALSNIVSKQQSPQDAFTQANSEMTSTLQQAGLIQQ